MPNYLIVMSTAEAIIQQCTGSGDESDKIQIDTEHQITAHPSAVDHVNELVESSETSRINTPQQTPTSEHAS